MIQGEYNGEAIQTLDSKGKIACWNYIKSIPEEFQEGCISTIKSYITKRLRES